MEIRLISTLTPEDEDHFAPALLRAAVAILDQTELAYTLRIETTSEKVFQHDHPALSRRERPAGPRPVERRTLDAQWLAPPSVAETEGFLP